MSEFFPVQYVLCGDEVRDRYASLFAHGSQVDEVVEVAVVESDGHSWHGDRTFPDELYGFAQTHDAVVAPHVVHLPEKIGRSDTETMWTIAYQVVIENHHWKILRSPIAAIAQCNWHSEQQRFYQQFPAWASIRIAVSLVACG